jgi:hypothetical protein
LTATSVEHDNDVEFDESPFEVEVVVELDATFVSEPVVDRVVVVVEAEELFDLAALLTAVVAAVLPGEVEEDEVVTVSVPSFELTDVATTLVEVEIAPAALPVDLVSVVELGGFTVVPFADCSATIPTIITRTTNIAATVALFAFMLPGFLELSVTFRFGTRPPYVLQDRRLSSGTPHIPWLLSKDD